ncbi:MAG: LolA-related protein [Steroidobacter sp.]
MRRLPMLALLSAATLCSASERDVAGLVAQLAKPAPATIEFTEVRFSHLVREPLIVSGELGYSGPTSLDRRVTTPYREHTSIRGESVKVEREGEKPRSFALKHAPELRGLLAGFSAMLSGDADALQRAFTAQASGSGNEWVLKLRPKDAKAQRRLARIEVTGSGAEPRCFSMVGADNSFSVLLLGTAAKEPLPDKVTEKTVSTRCGLEALSPVMPAPGAGR